MILTVTPNPCVDKTVFIDTLTQGEKHRAKRYTCIPGGKGTNVSRAVKALGYETTAMVIVGGHTGHHVVEMMEQQDEVNCVPVWVNGMTRTITTVLEEVVHRQTVFFEPGPLVSPVEHEQLLRAYCALLPKTQVVTLNGAVPHETIRHLYKDLIEEARKAGVKTILDSYGVEFDMAVPACPTLVKPNLEELAEWTRLPVDTTEGCWAAMDELHANGVDIVVVSQGKDGAFVSQCDTRLHIVPPAIEEINPVGSGDALVAGLAIGLQEGWALEKMAQLGVAAGTANAMSWEIGHFTKEEVEEVMGNVVVQNMKNNG